LSVPKKRPGQPPGVPKTGGRKAGTPNRRTLEMASRLADLGVDPLDGIAKLLRAPKTAPELRARLLCELLAYLYPKRKAIEFVTDSESDGSFTLEELMISYRQATQAAPVTRTGA
jgi:hypothetical protein